MESNEIKEPMVGRWALLAGLVLGSGAILIAPAKDAPWLDLVGGTTTGVFGAWLVLAGHGLWQERRASGANACADVGDGPHTD